MNKFSSYINEKIWGLLCSFIIADDRSIGVSTYPDYDDTLRSIAANAFEYKDFIFYVFINHEIKSCAWLSIKNIKVIKKNSLRGVYYYHRCKFIFYTHNLFSAYKKSNKKIVINLWHGLPIKKVGLLNHDKFDKISNFDYLISDNKIYSKILQGVFGVEENKILISEHPRVDQIYSVDTSLQFKQVLWLPTFRTSEEESLLNNYHLLNEVNNLFKDNNTQCIIKLHPLELSFDKNKRYSNINILSDHDFNLNNYSLYKMIGQAEFVISDVSSVYFDCINNNIDVILFCRDLESYSSKRGFIDESLKIISNKIIANDLEFLSELKDKLSKNRKKVYKPKHVTKELFQKYIKMIFSALTFLTVYLIYDTVRTSNLIDKVTKVLIYSTFIEFGYNSSAIQTSIRDISQSELFQIFGFFYLTFIIARLKVCVKKPYLIAYIIFILAVVFSDLILVLDPTKLALPKPGDSLDQLASNTLDLTVSGISNDHYLRILRLFLLYPFFHVISSNLFNIKLILSLSRRYTSILIVILIFEILLKLSGSSVIYEATYGFLVNQDISENLLQFRGGLPTLHGLTQEPSHLAYAFIFPALILSNKSSGILYTIGSIFLLLSGSFRSFLVGIFIAIKNFKLSQLLILFCSVLLILSFTDLNYFSLIIDRFHGLIDRDFDESSTSIRMVSWGYALDAFDAHPFFGVGLGSISSSSGLLGSAASVGIIGMIAYFNLVVNVYEIKTLNLNLAFLLIFLIFSFNVNVLYSFPIINLFLYSKIND